MTNNNKYFLPAEEVNDEKAIIVKKYFNSGNNVKKGDLIYSFETTKSIVDVSSETDGFIQYYVTEGDELYIGSLVCEVSIENKKTSVISNKLLENKKVLKPTKKAIILAEKHNINIEELGLEGIIKEKDLLPHISSESGVKNDERCLFIDKNDNFVKYLCEDQYFRNLSSEKKIDKYRNNGHKVGNNVKINDGAVLIGNSVEIGDNVSIGQGTYIESPEIIIGANTTIGNNCEFVSSRLVIGEYNTISNRVFVDISGGRSTDSNLITGRGCLISYEAYINVCHEVNIGGNVALSPRSMIYTHSYWQSIIEGYSVIFGPVSIDDNAWLGSVSQILPNIKVGAGSIVMSNSLVSSDVKPYSMVGGVPAKILKENLKKKLSEKNKEKIIELLFSNLGDWLYSYHFDIEKINNRKMLIENENEKKSCLLLGGNYKIPQEKVDIVIAYNMEDEIPISFKTLLDLKK